MLQSHVDITRSATPMAASAGLTSSTLAGQLRRMAEAIAANSLAILHWETRSGRICNQASFPVTPQGVMGADCLPLVQDVHAGTIAHPDQIVQHLSNKRTFIQRLSPEARSSSAPSVSSYLYGSMVHDQAANVQILLVETLQPLTSQQTFLLEVWIDGLKRTLAMEQEMQRQQAKIALLEQVIQHTAHQARQPLSLIELYTDVMLSLSVDDPVRSQLDLMRSATTDLEHHIQHLADYGVRNTLQLELHGLQEIWATSLQQVRPWADEKQIRIVNTSDSIRLMCDRWQMGQVFNNLLLNAIHFSPIGGTITCQWQRFQEEVLVELWDEGPGIDENDLPKIFMPFHSRRQGGTGIGLSVVKKIVLDHHGQCWAANLPSGGAKFSFTLNC